MDELWAVPDACSFMLIVFSVYFFTLPIEGGVCRLWPKLPTIVHGVFYDV